MQNTINTLQKKKKQNNGDITMGRINGNKNEIHNTKKQFLNSLVATMGDTTVVTTTRRHCDGGGHQMTVVMQHNARWMVAQSSAGSGGGRIAALREKFGEEENVSLIYNSQICALIELYDLGCINNRCQKEILSQFIHNRNQKWSCHWQIWNTTQSFWHWVNENRSKKGYRLRVSVDYKAENPFLLRVYR